MSAEHASLRENIKALPPAAWVLFAGTFVNRLGSFVIVFLVLYLTREGYSVAQAGLAVSAYGVGSIAAATVGGVLADKLGRRYTIALSMFTAAATMLALSQAVGYALVVMLTGLVGFTAELYRPASAALLTDLTRPAQRVAAFAVYRLAINLGTAVGPALGGFMADRSFFLLFVGDALTATIFGFIALAALPKSTGPARSEGGGRGNIRVILADRAFTIFLLASIAAAFVYFQSFSTLPLQVKAHGFSSVAYGGLISLNGLLVLIFELPLTSITQRLRPRPVMAVGLVLIGIGFGLTALAHSLIALALTVVVWTAGEILHMPVAAAYVANIAPEHMRGRYQGAFGVTFGLGFVLGPGLGSMLFAVTPGGLWLACFVCGVVAAGLVLAIDDPPPHSSEASRK